MKRLILLALAAGVLFACDIYPEEPAFFCDPGILCDSLCEYREDVCAWDPCTVSDYDRCVDGNVSEDGWWCWAAARRVQTMIDADNDSLCQRQGWDGWPDQTRLAEVLVIP